MPADPCDVLVVDDDDEIRESLVELLEERGFRAAAAADGAQALAALRAGLRPSLILLDLMMPVMDGVTFRQRQLADPDLAAIPVVLVSAFENVEEDSRRMGARGALRKPISFRDLLDLVRRVCLHGDGHAPSPAAP
jgi:CheY-like chemotaxis protein